MISFAVTAKLICVFVFAYANSWFSHEAAHLYCLSPINRHTFIISTTAQPLHNTYVRSSQVPMYRYLYKQQSLSQLIIQDPTKMCVLSKTVIVNEPVHEKNNNLGSDQV